MNLSYIIRKINEPRPMWHLEMPHYSDDDLIVGSWQQSLKKKKKLIPSKSNPPTLFIALILNWSSNLET